MTRSASPAQILDLMLPAIELEAGARIERHMVRGWWWGPAEDLPILKRRVLLEDDVTYHGRAWRSVARTAQDLEAMHRRFTALPDRENAPELADLPTVLIVHALTGDMRAGGPGGWWEGVIGPDRELDPNRYRLLCFNLLGSCYGSSGPADEGFPTLADDKRFLPPFDIAKGNFRLPESRLPATITSWDQARSILMALDALGVSRIHLALGGSLGAMIVLCLAALAPDRIERIAPIGAADRATPWVIGWSHVQRMALLLDPDFPSHPRRGLEIARQIGMLTYRAEEGLELRQGREMVGVNPASGAWSSRGHYKIQTYLEHQGQKLISRFDSRSYLSLIGAMDHHDLARRPAHSDEEVVGRKIEATSAPLSWGLDRFRASSLLVGIDSDQLFFPGTIRALAENLRGRGLTSEFHMLHTPFGHDGFLIETDLVNAIIGRALLLPWAREKRSTWEQ